MNGTDPSLLLSPVEWFNAGKVHDCAIAAAYNNAMEGARSIVRFTRPNFR
jgi:hypothetical protein